MEMEREQRARESTGEVRFSYLYGRCSMWQRMSGVMMLTTRRGHSRSLHPAPRHHRQERKGERHSRFAVNWKSSMHIARGKDLGTLHPTRARTCTLRFETRRKNEISVRCTIVACLILSLYSDLAMTHMEAGPVHTACPDDMLIILDQLNMY